MILTLNKHLTMPKLLPAWMYRDPLEIVAQLEATAYRREIERRNKHRRIEALTRKAMTT